MKKEKIVIIDSHALIHRAYHALPRLSTRKGELVNAVYGFISVLLKVLRELDPDYIAAAFDVAAPTFRHQEYKEYKAASFLRKVFLNIFSFFVSLSAITRLIRREGIKLVH